MDCEHHGCPRRLIEVKVIHEIPKDLLVLPHVGPRVRSAVGSGVDALSIEEIIFAERGGLGVVVDQATDPAAEPLPALGVGGDTEPTLAVLADGVSQFDAEPPGDQVDLDQFARGLARWKVDDDPELRETGTIGRCVSSSEKIVSAWE